MDNEPIVLSHSRRGTLYSCQRKFALQTDVCAAMRETDTYAADCGSALHIGIQDYVVNRNIKHALFKFLMNFPYELEFAENKPSRRVRSLEATISAFISSVNSFDWSLYDAAKFVVNGVEMYGVEISFAIKLINTGLDVPVYFMGHIDLILFNRATGEFMVFDIKTTRMHLDALRWRFDQQTMPYGMVLAALQGKEITKLTTHYLTTYIDLNEPQTREFKVEADTTKIEQWVIGIADDVNTIKRNRKRAFWPRAHSGSSCVAYNSRCRFADLCASDDMDALRRLYPNVGDEKAMDFYTPSKATIQLELDIGGYM